SRCMILLFLFQLYRDRRLLHSFPTRRSSDLVNQLKSASNIDNEQVYGNKLDDVTGYKYLGVLEDSRNMIKEENKVIIAERVTERTAKLCQTKLNSVNLFKGINEFASSTVNYYIGLLPYEPKEFEEMDKQVRDRTSVV